MYMYLVGESFYLFSEVEALLNSDLFQNHPRMNANRIHASNHLYALMAKDFIHAHAGKVMEVLGVSMK